MNRGAVIFNAKKQLANRISILMVSLTRRLGIGNAMKLNIDVALLGRAALGA
jgi:hypothetical protein